MSHSLHHTDSGTRLQDIVDRAGAEIRLRPGEYEGPLVLTRSCVLRGSGATVWCEDGPVVTVHARHVRIEDLRIEVTGRSGSRLALKCESADTVLRNVEVYGAVAGLGVEDGGERIPRTIDLGMFAADHENVFVRRIVLPGSAELEAQLSGIHVEPRHLPAGLCEIRLITDKLRPDTCVWGAIFLRSHLIRRVYVRGLAVSNALPIREKMHSSPSSRRASAVRIPAESRAGILHKGERRAVSSGTIKVRLTGPTPPLGLDCYVFLLSRDGRVRSDEDLIFFGQPSSPDGAAVLLQGPAGPGAKFVLGNMPESIDRAVMAFSLYDAPASSSAWRERTLAVEAGSSTLQYQLAAEPAARTIIALHLYRYGDGWKIWTADQRSRQGIAALCSEYGVQVE